MLHTVKGSKYSEQQSLGGCQLPARRETSHQGALPSCADRKCISKSLKGRDQGDGSIANVPAEQEFRSSHLPRQSQGQRGVPAATPSEGAERGETLKPTGRQTFTPSTHPRMWAQVPRRVVLLLQWAGRLHHSTI